MGLDRVMIESALRSAGGQERGAERPRKRIAPKRRGKHGVQGRVASERLQLRRGGGGGESASQARGRFKARVSEEELGWWAFGPFAGRKQGRAKQLELGKRQIPREGERGERFGARDHARGGE